MECTDPIDRMDDLLNEIIPDSPNKPYDMYEVIGAITVSYTHLTLPTKA